MLLLELKSSLSDEEPDDEVVCSPSEHEPIELGLHARYCGACCVVYCGKPCCVVYCGERTYCGCVVVVRCWQCESLRVVVECGGCLSLHDTNDTPV